MRDRLMHGRFRWVGAALLSGVLLAASSATIISLQAEAARYRTAQLYLTRLQSTAAAATYQALPLLSTSPSGGAVGQGPAETTATASAGATVLAGLLRREVAAWAGTGAVAPPDPVARHAADLAGALERYADALRQGDRVGGLAIYRTSITRAVSELTVAAAGAERELVEQLDVAEGRARIGVVGISVASLVAIGLLLWRYGVREARIAQDRARREEMARSEARLAALVTHAADGIVVLDPNGDISYASPSGRAILGHDPEQLVGTPLTDRIAEEDRDRVAEAFAAVLATPGATAVVELRGRHSDGSTRTLHAIARNLLDDPAVGGVVVNYRDVTERVELERELRHQALHDPLTGLANRALFRDRLDRAVTHRGMTGRVALALVDLDDFKLVNDTYGHDAGDQLLRDVADRLRSHVRPEDTVARLGGDEFAVLAEDLPDPQAAAALARRVLSAFAAPFEVAGRTLPVAGSVGVAVNTEPDATAETLSHDADMAMYVAKGGGKGRWALYDPSMTLPSAASLELRTDLLAAFGSDQLQVHYQPVVDLGDGHLLGAEALVRWSHPTRGPVPPGELIPLAEQAGLIRPLGQWILEEACGQVARWNEALGKRELTVSVNLSPAQLNDPQLVPMVREALVGAGVDAHQLVLEVTEGVLVTDEHVAVSTFSALRALGVRIAVDDFGTGYSSLSYLRRFPIDVLKVDQTFVAALGEGPEAAALARAIVDIGRTLHLATVAEGVEDARQVDTLRELSCQMAQGYFFARPMAADEMAALAVSSAVPVAPRSG